MRVIVCENYAEMSAKAAELVTAQLTLKPNSVLGLATGSTPIGMYNKLGELCKNGEVDFSEAVSFNLDEYYPIKRDDPNSYYTYMHDNLFSKINIAEENTHILNGETTEPEKECETFEKQIKMHGGIDLQILGIGRNGHIGFNEPDAVMNSYTHVTKLAKSTIKANSRFFKSADDVPRMALTVGMSTILTARKIILMASGAAKSRVVSELMGDGINLTVPAALLKLHSDVVLICDKEAYRGARLGVDIGGTNIKLAVVEGDEVKLKKQIKTKDTCDGIIGDITAEIADIRKQYDIKAVGIGTPGIIDTGRVTAVNLPFKDTPLESIISEQTGLAVTVDNDASCAALGEVMFGGTKDCENIVLITLGTGLGGGIILNRAIFGGKSELGHIVIEADSGKRCACGQKGCWETYSSARALIKYAEEQAKANKDSILYRISDNGTLTGQQIFEAMDMGCDIAKTVFERYIRYLAVGIRNIINIFSPDAVVLAGGITKQGDKLLKPLLKELPEGARVEISALQEEAGALGAAML